MTVAANSSEGNPSLILALDIGTSSVRAMLFDSTGAALPQMGSQHTYDLLTSNEGEVAVDADMLVELVARCIDELLAMVGARAKDIVAVAADTFWHSLVGVDEHNKAIMPLITWEDTRPHHAAEELRQQLDEQAIHERTGATLHASYWPAKLLWLQQTQPAVFQRASQWLSFGEYLHRQLLGHSVCSLSMASGTGMLLTRQRAWDLHLAQFLHLRPDQLPSLGDVRDGIQGLLPPYASRWPVLNALPWFPAVGDGAAANVGSGATSVERWALTIGTSAAIRVVVSPDETTPPPGLWLYLVDAQRGLLGGALSEGGNLFAWLEETLRIPHLPEVDTQVADMPPDAHGLTILPFISGERSLGWHADARLTISGLNGETKPLDIMRAMIEALAYQLDAVFERVNSALAKREIAPVVIGSGGALNGSHTLQQIIADTLDTPLHLSLEHEASARGAALLALEALDIISNIDDVPLSLAPPVQPDATRHALYELGMQRQLKLYQEIMGQM